MIQLPSSSVQTLSCAVFQQQRLILPVCTFVYLTRASRGAIFVLDITQFFMHMKTLTNRQRLLFTNSNLLNWLLSLFSHRIRCK
jgi:hypothetical protein